MLRSEDNPMSADKYRETKKRVAPEGDAAARPRIAPLPSLPERETVEQEEPKPVLRLAGEKQIGGAPTGGLLANPDRGFGRSRSSARKPGIRLPDEHAPREVLGDAAMLFQLARHDRAEDVRRLLENGADPNHSDDPGNVHLEAVSFMCRNEDVGEDTPDGIKFGRTACHMAAVRGHAGVVSALIAGGCNVNSVDHAGKTPLMRAAGTGFLETARLLVQAGADVNARDLRGATALLRAAGSGHGQVVRYLIESGAEVDALDCTGRTALLHAARGAHAEVVQALVSAGADVHLRDATGDDALSAAVQAVVPEDPHAPSPFHVVREGQLLPVVTRLIDAGARDVPDAAGVRPSERAEQLGHHAVAALLRAPA